MIVEIINVGTELLLGEIMNTNATYLQKICKEFGFDIYYQSVVGDNPERFKQCLEIAFNRGADCVMTTGGLGPTQDDLTKELSAEYLGLEMIYIEAEAKKVDEKCQFVTGLDVIPDNNFKQAYFPKNAYVLENEVGTANGCVMKKDDKMIINLPGPPKELKWIVENSLKPYLLSYRKEVLYTEDIITMGIGESKVSEVLAELIDEQKEVSIATYASEEVVRIRLGCKAFSQQEADEKMAASKSMIEGKLKEYMISSNLSAELNQLLPSYQIIYKSDFTFRDSFLNQSSKSGEMKITVDTQKHKLGEIVIVELDYQNKIHQFHIPLLKKAELSYAKLEAKIINQLVWFLRSL